MIKTAKELASAAQAVATNHKTLYVLGCFGWPLTDSNKTRAINAQAFNRKAARKPKIQAASADTYGFDCVCLIKALLWGWEGDAGHVYGGAAYGSNNVPDKNADQMIDLCSDVSTDFSNIQVGEAVWIKGHIGLYIGDGLAVECTYRWNDGVQITAVHNIGTKSGYNGRKWTKHGKLPWVNYEEETKTTTETKKGDYTMELRNLKKGCKGEDVKALQILLIGRGYSCGSAGADGDFGSGTYTAVTKYQKAKGLTVDGIAGEKTMRSLMGV